MELAKRFEIEPIRFSHNFQTNGTLLTQDYIEFLKTVKGVNVGVSLDGPKFIHDKNRIDYNGNGTFDNALKGWHLLKEAGIPCGVLSTYTSYSLDYADAIFDFYYKHDILDVGFNAEYVGGANQTSSLNRIEYEQKYTLFIERLWERVSNSDKKIFIREFHNAIDGIYNRKHYRSYGKRLEINSEQQFTE